MAAAASAGSWSRGYGVQVDDAEQVQRRAQDEHRRGDGECTDHQRASVTTGQGDPRGEEQQRQDRQRPRGRAEQPEARLRLGQVGGLEERERRGDRRQPVGEGEAPGDQTFLDGVDQHGEVELDRVALHLHGVAGLAGEHRHHLRVCLPVRLLPGRRELLGPDQLGDLGVHEVVDAVVQRRQQRSEAGGGPWRQATLGECVHRLLGDLVDVQPTGDGVADPRDDDVLHGRVVGQGRDRLDVAFGVGHRVVRPGRHHGQRCEYGGQQHAQADEELAPPRRPRVGRLRLAGRRIPVVQRCGQPVDLSPKLLDLGLRWAAGVSVAGGHGPGCTAWMCSVRSRNAPTITMKP